jgi:hypothetical protein
MFFAKRRRHNRNHKDHIRPLQMGCLTTCNLTSGKDISFDLGSGNGSIHQETDIGRKKS